ncbi:PAS domain-containing protein [Xinfangfangia pollutisoli]|uniref:PAS domain-containing protein n=1 Tax=Xinfangfangia pollutisoli TaxID=2865960 RepID=UPI001CD72AB5|nr:PAS domain-containing protein [Xinfangfangia pollutisoli]
MVLTFFGGKGSGTERAAQRPEAWRPLQVLRAYWEGLRDAQGGLPARSDIDPRGLAPALDQVFIAERIGTGLIRMRISGMGLTDLAGLDMKGLPLSTLFLPEARARLAEVIERVFTLPVAAELHLEAERTIGRPALAARLLLLPLRSVGGKCDLVLGCLATEGQIGRAPRRFAIARAVEERLILAGDAPMPQALAPEPALIPAFAEAPAPAPELLPLPLPPQAVSRPIKGRPHLRLVHSAD